MSEENELINIETPAAKPPRIVLVASRRSLCEYPLYMKYLLVGLADEAVPAMLVCPPEADLESIAPPAVEVIRHPSLDIPLALPYNLRVLLGRIRKFQPDLFHCLCETKAHLTRWLTRRLGIPYVVNVNSTATTRLRFALSARRCAAIVAPTKTIADQFASNHPRFADRVSQINIGTFVGNSATCFADPKCLPGMLVAHPLNKPAELDNLLGAVRRLAIDGYKFMLALIGPGLAERQLRKKLRSLGLLKIVTVVHYLYGPYSSLAAADIFIVPRPSRYFNALLLAAMSRGSAVAAAKGGVDDLLIENQTAVVFDPDDQLSIYDCLKRLLDRHDEARRIAAAAQQFLRQNHHVSDMVASTLSLYQQTAKPAEVPAPV